MNPADVRSRIIHPTGNDKIDVNINRCRLKAIAEPRHDASERITLCRWIHLDRKRSSLKPVIALAVIYLPPHRFSVQATFGVLTTAFSSGNPTSTLLRRI